MGDLASWQDSPRCFPSMGDFAEFCSAQGRRQGLHWAGGFTALFLQESISFVITVDA